MSFQIMGTKHLGVPDKTDAFDDPLWEGGNAYAKTLEWPHATPIYDAMCRRHGNPSGHDYQAYLRPWSEL